jgi:transcriptional antiterminator RfaH
MYWACAQLQTHRERLALHCLGLAGFVTYMPRLRIRRLTPTRRMSETTPALFPGYCFIWITSQWHAARWQPGVIRLVLNGERPAVVSEGIIDELKGREHNGLIDLPKARPSSPSRFTPGMTVRVLEGPLQGLVGMLAALRPHERVLVLLQMLGGERRIELAQEAIRAIGEGAL